MTTPRIRLGDLLVSTKVISDAQLEEALGAQKGSGRRLGEVLVALGHVTELQVAQTLSHQLSIPWVNLHHVDFSRELLNLVSGDVAVASRVVPIYVRKVRQQGDVLFVATDDPLNEASLLQVAQHVGMPVKAMVASALELRNALRVYYGRIVPGPEPLASRLVLGPPSIPPESIDELEIDVDVPISKVASVRPPALHEAEGGEPAHDGASASSSSASASSHDTKHSSHDTKHSGSDTKPLRATPAPSIEPGPVTQTRTTISLDPPPPEEPPPVPTDALALGSAPRKRPASRPKMLTLTLLDGTKVSLPSPAPAEVATPPEHHLTTRDLIQALHLHAEGKDVSAVLRDVHWETLFATLLSVLLRKGLIADWEFVEEWQKQLARRAGGESSGDE